MNKVYKVIWSEVSETFVAVPEVVRGASKSSSASPHGPHKTVRPGHAHFFIKSLVAALICIGFTFAIHAAPLSAQLAPASANQLPTGAQVSAGSATVSQSGSVLTLKQTTPKAAVNWQTFNVGAQAQVDIVQPSSSSVLLNRVLDSNPSQIFGKINANGQVFLENPNGVYFAPSASVDTGSFLATTSNISDADFMAGNYRFDRNGATGTIVNQGKITSTLGGYIALLAQEVRNAGVVVARGGTIVLAAGETYQLQFESNNTLTNILVSPSTVAAYIENGNAVQAPGGLIILSAQAANAIQGGVIKNTGSITADVLINDGGVIRLVASSSINHSGTISADASPSGSGNGGQISLVADLANPQSQTLVAGLISAKGGGQGGRGGYIETSGSFVHVDDQAQINTSAPRGTGGSWLLDPTDYTVGTGGDITGATLGSQLNTTSVTISSSGGATGSGGNIFVNDAVTWTGANRLTLSAANNISIANNINVPTGGSVSLVYGSSTGSGSYNFGAFSAARTSFTGAINFAGTGAGLFTTQLGSNTPISYTVIQNPSSSTGGVVNSAGNYALGQNYSFSSSFASSPITGTFSGNFDGLGHTVSNLVGTGASGLFNVSSGTLQNIGVSVSINAGNGSYVGGLANYNSGLINNSYSTGSITGSAYLGGLVGLNSSSSSTAPSKINNSFSTASVTGTASLIGGLIGENTTTGTGASSTVSNSFATGAVTGATSSGTGGLIGYNYAAGQDSFVTITNSFATGNVSGPSSNNGSNYLFGGLIGLNRVNATGADASVSNSYATGSVNAAASVAGGLIGNNQVLSANGSANLTNVYATGAVNTYSSTSINSQSVGGLIGGNTANSPGSSATVSNSHATGSVNGSIGSGGLIGYNLAQNGANASVSNSYATGSVQSNSYNAGGLIGSNYASYYNSSSQYDSTTATVSSSYATGNVSVVDGITASSDQNTWGGLIGLNQSTPYNHRDTSVSNSYATGSVSAMGNNLGGLIGNNQSSGKSTVTNSYATGAVTSSGSGNVGGLIGLNQSNYASDTSSGGNVNVSGSYASGVTTGVNYVGGLIGYNSIGANSGTGIIDASYANANVNATSYVGGLVGGNLSGGSSSIANITNSYVVAGVTVLGANTVGGMVGSNSATNTNSSATLANSYSNATVSANGSNVGGLVGSNTASAVGSNSNISQSYATGNVTSTNAKAGGLAGQLGASNTASSNVDQSFATGSVQSAGYAGGLIGYVITDTAVSITNSFSAGNVVATSGSYFGGFIGGLQSSLASVNNSYASGSVTGAGQQMGGFLGNFPSGASISNNYWNTTVNPTLSTSGVNGVALNNAAIKGLSTAQMQTLSSFNGFASPTWGAVSFYNNQYPYLSTTTPLAQITLANGGNNYGTSPTLNYTFADASGAALDASGATGSPVWTLSANGSVVATQRLTNTTNAGDYSVTYAGGLSLGRYTLMSPTPATWSVQKVPLGISIVGNYSGTTTINPTSYTLTGLVNSETLAPATVVIADPNVTTANNYVTSIVAKTGTANVNNYQITPSYNATSGTSTTNTASVNGLVLRVSELASVSGNYYNGSAYTGTYTINATQASDLALITVTGMPTGVTPGTYPSNLVVTLTGSALSNFVTPVVTNANLVISPKIISIVNSPLVTTYDRATQYSQLASNTLYTSTAMVGSDTLASITQTASVSGLAQAGTYTVTPSAAQMGSGVASNYQFRYVSSLNTVRPLGITASSIASASSAYGDVVTPGAVSLSGVLAGDTVTSTAAISNPTYSTSSHLKAASYFQTAASTSLSGTDAGNYSLTAFTTPTANYNVSTIAVTGSIAAGTSTYGAALAPGAVSLTGKLVGDLVTSTASLVSPAMSASNNVKVGSYNQTATTLSGNDAGNYTLAGITTSNLNYQVNPLAITVSSISNASSVYGSLLTPGVVNLSGVQGVDAVSGSASVINLLYSTSAHVKAGTYQQASSSTLSGVDSGNYTLTAYTSPSATYTVTALPITVSAIAPASSAYGAAISTGAVTLNGVLASDTVGSASAISSPLYSSSLHLKAQAFNQTAASNSLNGADAGNYSLTAFTTSTPNYTVTPIAVNGTIAAAASTYAAALAPGAVSLTGKLVGDVVTSTASLVSPAMSASNNVKVGSYNQTATTLSGNDAGNYTLAGITTSNLNYQVNPLAITVSSISNASSVYGSLLTPGVVNLSGVQGVDAVSGSASVINLLYSSSNNVKAGTYPQRASSLLTGNDAANYSLSAYTTPSSNYTVSALPITVGSIAPAASNYGATVAPGAVTLNGVLGSDLVSSAASIVSASYSTSAHLKAGSYNQGASTLTNTDAANYTLTAYTSPTATYTVNALALSANIAAATSSYGATVTPGSVSLGGVLALDVVSASATIANPQNSASAHLKAGSYNQTATTLSGGDAANYTLAATTTNLNYVVSPLTISVASIASATSVYGAQVQTGAVNLSGVVGSDAVLSSASIVSPAYSSSNHLKAAAYNQMASTVLSGNDAVNYTLTPYTTPAANYTVTPLGITASIASANSVYGSALTPGEVTLSGKLTGDVVQSMASVVNPNLSAALQLKAGSYNQSATTLSGVDASNYSLTAYTTNNLNYVVTPLALTASIADATSVYGSAVTPGAVTMLGVIAGDQVSSTASVATPLTSTSNRMSAGTYTQTASVLSGNDASNYSFAPYTTPVANYTVTPLGITALSIDPAQSNYGATVSTGAVTLLGVLAGDVASSTAAIFAPALSSSNHLNAGSFKQTATTLNGADAANYSLTPFTTPTPNYTVTALPLTAAIASATSNYGSASNAGVVTFTGGLTGDVFTSVVALVNPAYSTSNHLKVGSYNQAVNTLTGIDSGNYTLSAYTTTTPNYVVTPLALSGSIAGVNVNYGSALTPGLVTLIGGLSGDSLSSTASLVAAVYSSSGRLTVGSYQQTASVLGGSDASNYTFSGVTTPSANYVVAPISLNASVAAVSLNYGLANAPGGVSLTGVLSGDAVQSVAQIANTANSSSGRLRVGNYSQTLGPLSGTDARNYTLSNGGASFDNYSVKPLAITVASIAPATSIYASSTTPGSVALTGVLGADQVASQASIVNPLLSSSKNLAAGAYNQAASLLSGSDAGNYSLSAFTTASPNYTVKPLSITASIAPSTSVYGATLVPGAVALGGVIKGDEVASLATLVSPMYSSSLHLAVGNYAQSASTLSGADANNYSLAAFTTPSASYSVSPLMISASVSPVLTTYADAASTGWVALTGALMGDGVAGVSSLQNPTFSSSQHLNAGSYVQNMALSGLDAKNYSLASTQTPTANYTVAPLSLMGAISPSSSVSGSPLSPGVAQLSNVLPGDRVGDVKVVVNMAAAGAASNTGSPVATTVGTFVGAQGVSALSGPDAANYSWANVKGDYTVKAGFSAATVYPQESLTSTSQVTPMLKALDATSALALKNSPAGSDNTPPSNSSSNASTVANQSQRALSVPSKGEDSVVASNTVPNAAGADNAAKAGPNTVLAASPLQSSSPAPIASAVAAPTSLASVNSKIDVPQTRYFVPGKPGTPAPSSNLFQSAQANELPSTSAFSSPSSNARLDANPSFSLQNKTVPDSSELSGVTALAQTAQGTLESMGQVVGGIALAIPAVGEAISTLVAAAPVVGDVIHGMAVAVPVVAEAVTTLSTTLTFLSAASSAPIVPVPAPSPGVPINSMGMRLPVRWGAEG